MADEPTEASAGTEVPLTDLLEQTIAVALKRMAGPVYGTVDTYDAETERCSVKPLVPLLVNGELLEAPKIPSVPVEWPSNGGSHSYKFPLIKGSKVRLAPMGHDHSEWFTTATPDLQPPSERRFSIADLVASPVFSPPLASPPDPLSSSPTAAVLFGEHLIGGSDAVKAVALNADNNPAVALMATWMLQVETICNSVLFPPPVTPVAPLSPTFNTTAISSITATATKAKAK